MTQEKARTEGMTDEQLAADMANALVTTVECGGELTAFVDVSELWDGCKDDGYTGLTFFRAITILAWAFRISISPDGSAIEIIDHTITDSIKMP